MSYGYESPIKILISDIQTQMVQKEENYIIEATRNIGLDINKDEMYKALQYDRYQYKQGYRNGKAYAFHNCILEDGEYCWQKCCNTEHCKECKWLDNGDIIWFE